MRTTLLKISLGIYGLLLVFRLFYIQVINHDKYKAMAWNQYWDLSVIPARRGDILTRDNFTLAGTQTYYLMFLEPKKVLDKYKTAHDITQALKSIKKLDEANSSAFETKIIDVLNSDLYWFVLSRELNPDEKQILEGLAIEGVGFEEEPVRYYPEGNLAAHVLGFVAHNDLGEKHGYFGVEGALNEELCGKPGRMLQETDAMGNPILIGGFKNSTAVPGRDVTLTIDRTVQFIVEKELKEGVEEFDAKSGTVIVMDPRTGEILAMANYPTYNPRDFSDVIQDKDAHRKQVEKINLAISQTYEPGSVIKPFTVASAIDLGLIDANTTFVDEGPVLYSDYYINNWDGKHHGVQTIAELLEKSNNIGAAWVGHKVGVSSLYKYFTSFGIGKRTGIELEGEDTGYMRDPKIWTDIDLANISFGQGMSATPLQVLSAFNTFANEGIMPQSTIIKSIKDKGRVISYDKRQSTKVIEPATARTMDQLLNDAAHYGEAKFFVLKNYNISGKTGTAQIPFDGKYDPSKTNATFVGYLTNSKKFSMIVKLEQPQKKIYASETAVPIWMDIASELIKYYGIPKDR